MMLRWTGWLCVVVSLSFVAPACAEDKEMDGKWIYVSVERDGKTDDSMKNAVRVHKDGKYTISIKDGKSIEGTYKIDASKSPKTIDMVPSGGNYKGKTLEGIYKVDGDTLTVVFAEPGKERPKEFKAGPGVVFATLKREGK